MELKVSDIVEALNGEKYQGRRMVVPMFQRKRCWSEDKEKRLIDSLRRGYPIGAMMVYAGTPDYYMLIDGLQRCNTMKKYMSRPTDYVNIEILDDAYIEKILDMLFPADEIGDKKQLIEDMRNCIYTCTTGADFSELDGIKIISAIRDRFQESSARINDFNVTEKLNNLLKEYIGTIQEDFRNIKERAIPLIECRAPIADLPDIFQRINDGGTALSAYELYAAVWPDERSIQLSDRYGDIIRYVQAKYDCFKQEGYTLAEGGGTRLDPQSGNLTPYELAFGVGRKIFHDYPYLRFNQSAMTSDDAIYEFGFELLNACVNSDARDMDELYKRFNGKNVEPFLQNFFDAIDKVQGIILPYLLFKGNNSKKKDVNILHSKYQIISLVAFVYQHYYAQKDAQTETDLQDQEKYAVRGRYVYDIINRTWNEGGQKKVYMQNRPENGIRYYTQPISFAQWENMLNSAFREACQTRHETQKVNPPQQQEKILLVCISLQAVSAQAQIDADVRFDIEHLATKKKMNDLIARIRQEGLPISSVGNICYLPSSLNRRKKDMTFYEWWDKCRKEGLETRDLEEIERKYLLMNRDDLAWIDEPYTDTSASRKRLEQNYLAFISKRFVRQKILLYQSLHVAFAPDKVANPLSDEVQEPVAYTPVAGNQPVHSDAVKEILAMPPLPDIGQMKIGKYVKNVIRNLMTGGYTFNEAQLKLSAYVATSQPYTTRNLPMLLVTDDSAEREGLRDPRVTQENCNKRYWSNIFFDGRHHFRFYSQWYADRSSGATLKEFQAWYARMMELQD